MRYGQQQNLLSQPESDHAMRVYTSFAQATALPLNYRETIPESYEDTMGHMNVRHYGVLADEGATAFFATLGLDEAYYTTHQNGMFALRQFVQYANEVHIGSTIAVHVRLLGYSEKRLHFMQFLVNETAQNIAATFEMLGSHADLKLRKTSPFPEHIAANLQQVWDEHHRLGWEAPVSGIIKP